MTIEIKLSNKNINVNANLCSPNFNWSTGYNSFAYPIPLGIQFMLVQRNIICANNVKLTKFLNCEERSVHHILSVKNYISIGRYSSQMIHGNECITRIL